MVGHRSRVTAFWCKTLTSTDLHAVDLSDPSIGTSCLLRPPTLIRPPEKNPVPWLSIAWLKPTPRTAVATVMAAALAGVKFSVAGGGNLTVIPPLST
ncbi:hypothetical protein HanXRQr2_Chr07g0316991 [Helianthus annuus]|uniref:Uncharacterized protein n=1 Tax=Helianthus annuus TaxID=4232 RepID=A0A9K3IP64_HELAN|nr:hypothetical protein HanXRQr2_Chr07g0316991 [Helianthus annuus]